MISYLPLVGLLRLAEGIPETPDNYRTLHELINGLTALLNSFEKDDEGD